MSVCCEVMLDLCIDVSGIDRTSDEALYGTFSPLRLSNDTMHLLQTLTQRIVSIFLCFIYFFSQVSDSLSLLFYLCMYVCNVL